MSSVDFAGNQGPLQHTGGVWVTKPFKNWNKFHNQASEAVLPAAEASKEGTMYNNYRA